MAVSFSCSCSHQMLAADAHAGMLARCPACGGLCTVPAATGAREGVTDGAPASAAAAPAPEETRGGDVIPSAARQPCPVCRRLIPRGDRRCRFCGEFVDPHLRAASRKRFPYPRKTSYLAGFSIIVALVSMIASSIFWSKWLLWPCLSGPLVSLALGLWAIYDIKRAAGEKSGYWMAGFGLFLGAAALIKWLVELLG